MEEMEGEEGGREDWEEAGAECLSEFFSDPQFILFSGSGLKTRFGSLCKALQFAFPEQNWDPKKFSFRGKKSSQRYKPFLLPFLYPPALSPLPILSPPSFLPVT
jgi:hypothetical protein